MVKSCCGRLPKHCMVYKFPSIEGYANRSILLRLKEKINHGQFFFFDGVMLGLEKILHIMQKLLNIIPTQQQINRALV